MLKKLFYFLIAGIALSNCSKMQTQVGVSLLPQSDILKAGYAEIYPTLSYSKFDDSVMTRFITNVNLLGSCNDQVFGRTDASVYVNFEPQGIPSFGPNAALDSVVLSLIYSTSFAYVGDTAAPLKLDVFPIIDQMNVDSLYYSGRVLKYNKNYNLVDGGKSMVFSPKPFTNFHQNKDYAYYNYPQISVRLRKEFGEMLFNQNLLNSLYQFQNAFHGFYITTSNSDLVQPFYGSIFYVDMNLSSLNLYYHNDNSASTSFTMVCGGNSTRYAHFDHDYRYVATPALAKQLYSPFDTTGAGGYNIFLQGLAGLKVKMDFPDLNNWLNKNIVINKAELDVQVDNSNSDFFNVYVQPLPGRLYLEGVDPVTGMPSSLLENLYAFGGLFNSTTNQYVFEIPHTIKRIITGQLASTAFYLSVYSTAIFPQRVVLGGVGNNRYPMKLKLWYTDLNFPKDFSMH